MKSSHTLTLIFTLLITSTSFAAKQVDLPTPSLLSSMLIYEGPPPSYLRASEVIKPAPKPEHVIYPSKGVYGTVYGIYASTRINNVRNVSPTSDPTYILPTPDKSRTLTKNWNPGVAVGYQLRNSGIFSRFEISYTPIINIKYNINPFLSQLGPFSSISSKVTSHLILFKAYDDFDLGYPLMPYVEGGIGAAINKTNVTASDFDLEVMPGFDFFYAGDGYGKKTNLGAAAGAGVRYRLSEYLYANLGYEFDYLGTARWEINYNQIDFPSNTAYIKLKAGALYSNTLMAGLTWQPEPSC